MSRQDELNKIHLIQYQGWFEEAKKQNAELIKQAKEMAEAINHLKMVDNIRMRVMYQMLYELGGTITISQADIDNAEGKINATVDEQALTTTFFIEPIEPIEEGDPSVEN
jgi:hypothetical protein